MQNNTSPNTPEPLTKTNKTKSVSGGSKERSGIARIALRGTVWTTIANYITQLIGFASMLLLARLLAPELFGFFALASFWVSVVNLRIKAGLSYAAVQQKETTGDLLGTYLVLNTSLMIGTLILAVITSAILWYLGYRIQVIVMVAALIAGEVISLAASPLYMALERALQLSRLGLVSLVGYGVAYIIAISLALAGHGIWALISINLVYSILATIGIFIISRHRIPDVFNMRWTLNKALAKQLALAGITSGISETALSTIVGQFDNFLIGTFVSATTLGFYDRAYRIAQWPNLLIGYAVSKAGFLTFAQVKYDLPRLTHTVRLMFWALTSLSLGISIWLFFSANELIKLLLTDKWLPSAVFLRFLSITNFLWGFVSLGFWLSVALGHKRATIVISSLQATTLVLVATPLTLAMGSNGTLIGVGVSMLIGSIASCVYIFRHVRLSPLNVFLKPLVALILTILLLWGLTSLPAWSTLSLIVRILLTGISTMALILGVLFLLGPRELIDRIRYLAITWRPA